MYLPKEDIYEALSAIDVDVLQGSQKTIAKIPSITFYITNNTTNLNLHNEIVAQDVIVTVDIWATNSSVADGLLSQAEYQMRKLGYRMEFMADVPDPQNICHYTTQFVGIK